MNTESQRQRILKTLRSGKCLTKLECLARFDCMHAGARILELREIGWKIKTTMIKTASGKRVARYSLT